MRTVQINQRKLYEKIGYQRNYAQVRIHEATTQYRNCVVCAGRRLGKSITGGRRLMPESFRGRVMKTYYEDKGLRAEYWIVGPNYSDSEKEFRVFYNDCKRLKMPFDKPGTYYSADSGSMQVSLWGGTFLVRALSAAHPESLVGEGLHGVIMAEAAKMKESVWSKYVRPTLADFRGWSLFLSTPEGKNWFYERWQAGRDPKRTDWWSERYPSWVNQFVFRQRTLQTDVSYMKELLLQGTPSEEELLELVDEEVLAMYKDLGDLLFSQEVEARFTQYLGRVFADWDEEVHARPLRYDPDLPIYVATDYGWTDPNVALFIQTNTWGDVFILDEYYQRHRTNEEFANDVLAHPRLGPLARKAVGLYPDPADPKATRHLSRAWRVPIRGGTGGELSSRIALIRKWLVVQNKHLPWGHDERRPKLFVDSQKCPETLREMDAYRYGGKETGTQRTRETPLDKDNHTPEALGRFMIGKYGHREAGRGARVSRALVQG